jgi:putative membrane protein
LAALVHVYIFYMESVAWTGAKARATFGTTVEEAEVTKSLAFNQGFYNLFLAVAVATGVVFFVAGTPSVGAALVFAGAGSMVAAALVLFVSSPDKRAAALKQGVLPLLGVITMAIGLAL